MKLLSISRNFLLSTLAIYFAQGTLYPTGSYIAKLALVVAIVTSLLYFIKLLLIKSNKGSFFYAWTFLLLLNVFGFILTGDITNYKHFAMLKNILVCLLSFYPFYYFSIKGQLKSAHLTGFLIILLPLTISSYFLNERAYIAQGYSSNNEVVNNIAYSFVMLVPFAFLIKKRLLSNVLVLVLMFFIIQGSKRGAMISGFVGLLIFYYYQLKTINKTRRISGFFIALILISLLSKLLFDFFIENEFAISRLNSILEGNTSGREIMYSTIYNKWYNTENVLHQIFGFGFASSIEIAGDYAHSDWLELLSNFGVIGIFTYFIIFYSLTKLIRRGKWDVDKLFLILTIIVIWFIISLVSMWYTSLGTYTQAILLAFVLGSKNQTTSNPKIINS